MQHDPRSAGIDLALAMMRARYHDDFSFDRQASRKLFDDIVQFSGKHGVLPALAEGMENLVDNGLAWQELIAFFRSFAERNSNANAAFMTFAAQVIRALQDAGVAAVILKGGAFLVEDPDNAPWRQLTDIDMLVAPEQLQSAADALIAAGLQKNDDIAGFNDGLHHHYPALSDASGKFVELHVRLMQDLRDNLVRTEEVFAAAIPVQREGLSFLVPSPDHRMMHLVAHAQISNWGYPLHEINLKDMADSMELRAHHAIHWEEVWSAFERIGAERQLGGFVCATHHLLGLQVPRSQTRLDKGEAWATKAIGLLYQPENRWARSGRIAGHYLKRLARDPARLKLVMKTFADPVRLKRITTLNRQRLDERRKP